MLLGIVPTVTWARQFTSPGPGMNAVCVTNSREHVCQQLTVRALDGNCGGLASVSAHEINWHIFVESETSVK